MKFTHAMLFGLAMIVGVAIGYMFNPSVGEPVAEEAPAKAKGAIRDSGEAASLEALRARIAELEAELAKRGEAPAKPDGEKVAANDGGERRGPGAWGGVRSPKEWREKMKKDDPQRYAQITNHMARIRRDRQERAQKKSDFFASIDVSGMSPAARKVHEELQDLIAKNEEFEAKMQQLHESEADVSFQDMGEAFREMHETNRRIRELSLQERDNLMVEAAKGLGFDGDDAGEVAGIFQEIIDNTESGWGGGGPRGGGPRGGGPRGGGPRGATGH